jgi:hypothetical protein
MKSRKKRPVIDFYRWCPEVPQLTHSATANRKNDTAPDVMNFPSKGMICACLSVKIVNIDMARRPTDKRPAVFLKAQTRRGEKDPIPQHRQVS